MRKCVCVCVCRLQVTHTEETLASNTWSLMLKEVLSSLLKAPEGLFSGLTLLSELLPLPLPMHSTQVSLCSALSLSPLTSLVFMCTLILKSLSFHR